MGGAGASARTGLHGDRNEMTQEASFVTVVMPTFNEQPFVAAALESLLHGNSGVPMEIIVLDGGSTDRTRAIVRAYAASDARVRLMANEERYQSAGVNRGVAAADPRSTIVARADCHAAYPDGFLAACLQPFSDPRVASVVVPMITEGRTCFQRAVAASQNSRLGNGGAADRTVGASRFVEHGHHAAFRRSVFEDLGGYDETFSHNEDAELDLRIRADGGLIWLAADAAIRYFPRATPGALARQYFRYGQGRAKTLLKHRISPNLRQTIPLVVAATNLGALLLAPFIGPLPLVIPVGYVCICFCRGMYRAAINRDPCLAAEGVSHVIMHHSWAMGFVSQVVRTLTSRRPNVAT